MDVILIALHMVACQPDLLICKDVEFNTHRYEDMGDCLEARPVQMKEARERLPDWAVVMSRCRYLIARDRRSMPVF